MAHRTERVLIVDDNATDQALCRALLTAEGFDDSLILSAKTLAEAKVVLEGDPPHLCLIDYMLPDGRGVDLLSQINEHNSHLARLDTYISSIVVTGSGDEKLVASVFRQGAGDYVIKSDVIDHLGAAVNRALKSRSESIADRKTTMVDPVTRLLNRRAFLDKAQVLLKQHYQNGEHCALIYIDLDEFKKINDNFGHSAGDAYLYGAAHRIQRLCRDTDLSARLGGDEFVVFLRDISRCDLILKIDSWMKNNTDIFDDTFVCQSLRCSVGIAVTDLTDETSLSALITKADDAMYAAKRSGKNRYGFTGVEQLKSNKSLESFSSSHNSHHVPPTAILTALLDKEFSFMLQPIRDILTMEMESVEVLVRWSLMPNTINIEKVFDFFAEFNLDSQYFDWFIPEILSTISTWQSQGCQLLFSLNAPSSVDGCQVFLSRLVQSLTLETDYKIEPWSLNIEIKESILNTNPDFFKIFIRKMKALKIKITLDQFSRTDTNIEILAIQKFDKVKIRRYQYDADTEESFLKVLTLSSFLRMSMGCELVAVGVESLCQLKKVQKAGVDKVQGFYVGQPIAPSGTWYDFLTQVDQASDLLNKSNV